MGVVKSIYPNLAAEMRRQRIYQRDIAEWLGTYQNEISYKMTGKRKFHANEIYIIMQKMGVNDFLYLFKEER